MSPICKFKKADRVTLLSLSFSFIIPAVVILISYTGCGIAPFGDLSLCSMDGYSQYYPMLENMTEAFKEGELFYSFNGALGFNLWAQSAYYTSSPLWLIIYLLPQSLHISAINLLVLLRLSLAGLFFSLRLTCLYKDAPYKKKLFLFPALSCAYALSGYMAAFINQFMWTDVIVLLPLVIYGIERLWQGKGPLLYVFALSLSMISCFYISYMVCIFCALWFIFLALREASPLKIKIKKGCLFTLCSLISASLAAPLLLPVYKALTLTHSASAGFDKGIEIIYSLKAFLLRFLPFGETSLEYGEPNLYCTLTVVVLFVLMLFSKRFTPRYRITALIFVTFMLFSMSVNVGEYIWHGFHFPNQLPARQSFLAIFLLVSLAAAFLIRTSLKKNHLYLITALLLIFSTSSFTLQFSRDVWASEVSSLNRYREKMDSFTSLGAQEEFFRQEWADVRKNNYPQQYTYRGVTYYSSTMPGELYDFFSNMGMDKYAKNVSVYYKESDILNALFGLRYIMTGDEGEKIKENKDALSLAFIASEKALTFDCSDYEKGERAQEALWESLSGETDYKKGLRQLSEHQLEITRFTSQRIEGKIKAPRSSLLFTSIPYDEGWEIYIDGKKAETEKAGEIFLCCSIEEGDHSILMKFTPSGLREGLILSLAGLILFILIIIIRRRLIKASANSFSYFCP